VTAGVHRVVQRLRHALRPDRGETDLARELAAHRALIEEDYRRRGLSPDEARRAAALALGGVEQAKELHRDARSFVWMDDARRDAWQLLRTLNRHRGFAFAAILTLTIGIGANTALFSAFNAVVLRPLPYRDPAALVVITPAPIPVISRATIDAWRSAATLMTGFTSFDGTQAATLVDGGVSSSIDRASVAWNFFSFLGVPVIAGRDFTEADSRPGAPAVAILSHDAWQHRFSGDPAVIGRHLDIDTRPVTVVGVAAPAFRFPVTGWIPATGVSESPQPAILMVATTATAINVLGRLAPGAAAGQVRAQLLPAYRDISLARFPAGFRSRAALAVEPLHERLANRLRQWLLLVMGTVALVLLVACANVSSLLLARASVRRREFAVRSAIGAGFGRLVRLVITESVVLAAIASALALLGTTWVSAAARPLLADRMPHVAAISIDWRVFAFNGAVALAAGLGCGLVSLASVRSLDVTAAFSDSGTPAMSGRTRIRRLLLAVEVGFTFVLVLGAVLLAQTVRHLDQSDHGFNAHNVLTLRLSMTPNRLRPATDIGAASAIIDRLAAEVRNNIGAVAGVRSVGLVTMAPLTFGGAGFNGISIEGVASPSGPDNSFVSAPFVTPAYFDTMRTPLIEGRDFRDGDAADTELVAIVNEAFQRHFAPHRRSLLGAHILVDRRSLTVVGVVHDVSGSTLRDPVAPVLFLPLSQMAVSHIYYGLMSVMVRTNGVPPGRIAEDVRRAIWRVDPAAVIADVMPMENRVAAAMQTERQSAAIFTALAMVALLIAAIGVYGVGSYAVAQRTKEFGIRIALGAGRREVLRLVTAQMLGPTLLGMAVGIPVAAAATRLLAALLYGVTPLDLTSFSLAATVLAMAALAATIAPVRRVLRVDPLDALRVD
jgi:putative ABC transport system permease protein